MKTIEFIVAAALLLVTASCDPEDCGCICYEVYDPVCGSDGIEYSNDCFAECAGVTYTDGPCPVSADGLIVDWGPVETDGCDWVILIDTTYYHPDTLSAALKVDSLEVTLKYQVVQDTFLCGWAVKLPVIKVVEIAAK